MPYSQACQIGNYAILESIVHEASSVGLVETIRLLAENIMQMICMFN